MSYDVDIADETFNYTWNMSRFFSRFGVHPYDHMNHASAQAVGEKIAVALDDVGLLDMADLRERFDASNGWGSVPTAVDWLQSIREACLRHPDAIVSAS